MASRKVTIDTFPAEIQKILQKYGEDVERNTSQIVDETAQKGAQLLRNTSPVNPKGKKSGAYARGWRVEKGIAKSARGLNMSATIYNTNPGLPHLLEHGHALRKGGRTIGDSPAIEHIAKVDQLIFAEIGTRLIRL